MQWNHMEAWQKYFYHLSCSGCPMTWGLAQKSCLDASHYTLETWRDDKPKNLSSTKPNEVLERVEAVINTEWTSSMSQMRQDQFSMLSVPAIKHPKQHWSLNWTTIITYLKVYRYTKIQTKNVCYLLSANVPVAGNMRIVRENNKIFQVMDHGPETWSTMKPPRAGERIRLDLPNW